MAALSSNLHTFGYQSPLAGVDPRLSGAYLGVTALGATITGSRPSVKITMPIQIRAPDGP